MPSGVFDSTLLKHMWGTDELRAIFNDESRVQKWYDYEAALALSQAELGIIPQVAADEIAGKAKVGLRRSRSHRRRDPPHQAPAGAGAARPASDLRRRPRRIPALRPDHAGRARHRHDAADQSGACGVPARPASHRPRALPARRDVQGHADGGPHPRACRRCRSPSATSARSGSPRPGATISA